MRDRISILADLLQRLIDGINPEQVAADFGNLLNEITAHELAKAENLLLEKGVTVEAIQRNNELHADLVISKFSTDTKGKNLQDLSLVPGHPAFVFKGENAGFTTFLDTKFKPAYETFISEPNKGNGENLFRLAQEAATIIKHYDRKENLLFPYLERAGITAPPQVMWGADDIIRDLLKAFIDALGSEPINAKRVELVYQRLIAQLEHMIEKENNILLPMLYEHMNDEAWLLVASESLRMGYIFNKGVEGASNSDAATWLNEQKGIDTKEQDLKASEINLPSGNLSVEQLTAMLNSLPTDLTYIDENDIVRYYSEGKNNVFSRTKTIIGRDVYLCHPPQLVPTIKALVEAFRSGEKDKEIVPLRRGNLIKLVRYYAVRDEAGKYLGTVEVTEEISEIIDLVK